MVSLLMYSIVGVIAEMVRKKRFHVRQDDVNNVDTYSSRFEGIAVL